MEYKLNKIDLELRQQIQDSTKEGKVHSKQKTVINKDKKDEKRKAPQDFGYKLKKIKEKIKIDAVKIDSVRVEVYKDKAYKLDVSNGEFIDIKK